MSKNKLTFTYINELSSNLISDAIINFPNSFTGLVSNPENFISKLTPASIDEVNANPENVGNIIFQTSREQMDVKVGRVIFNKYYNLIFEKATENNNNANIRVDNVKAKNTNIHFNGESILENEILSKGTEIPLSLPLKSNYNTLFRVSLDDINVIEVSNYRSDELRLDFNKTSVEEINILAGSHVNINNSYSGDKKANITFECDCAARIIGQSTLPINSIALGERSVLEFKHGNRIYTFSFEEYKDLAKDNQILINDPHKLVDLPNFLNTTFSAKSNAVPTVPLNYYDALRFYMDTPKELLHAFMKQNQIPINFDENNVNDYIHQHYFEIRGVAHNTGNDFMPKEIMDVISSHIVYDDHQ